MIAVGSFVHSLDSRDDKRLFYIVLETGIRYVTGPVCKVALPGEEHDFVYRREALLRNADEEVDGLAQEANRLARVAR